MHVLGRRGSSTLPSVSLDACNQYAVDRHLHSMIVRMVFDYLCCEWWVFGKNERLLFSRKYVKDFRENIYKSQKKKSHVLIFALFPWIKISPATPAFLHFCWEALLSVVWFHVHYDDALIILQTLWNVYERLDRCNPFLFVMFIVQPNWYGKKLLKGRHIGSVGLCQHV